MRKSSDKRWRHENKGHLTFKAFKAFEVLCFLALRDLECLSKLKAQEEETLRLQQQLSKLGIGIVAGPWLLGNKP